MRNSLGVVILPVILILAACMNVEPVKARAAVNETVPAWAAMNETLSAWAAMNETLPAWAADETRRPRKHDPDRDFFKLVLQWPGSYAHSCDLSATNFSIHGLWQPSHGALPNCLPPKCRNPNSRNSQECGQYMLNPTKNLRTLKSEWPSLKCKRCDNRRFWNHEWMNHGVYGPFNCNPDNYTETTLRLRETVNKRVDLHRLRINGIYPRKNPWRLSEIRHAFNGVGGPAVRIRCNGQNQLFEIYLCFDRDLTFSSCLGEEFNCSEWVFFLQPERVAKCRS